MMFNAMSFKTVPDPFKPAARPFEPAPAVNHKDLMAQMFKAFREAQAAEAWNELLWWKWFREHGKMSDL